MLSHYKAMNNTITLASNPVREPKDLDGRTMGATAGDAPRVALPALAKLNDFDASKVEIITMESPAKPAMLMSKQVEGVFSLAAYTPVIAAAAAKRDEERSEEHTSELQSLMRISYAVFCLKKKTTQNKTNK